MWNPQAVVNLLPCINKKIRVDRDSALEGCCVWISACMAVHTYNREKAHKMYDGMKDDVSEYEWLHLFRSRTTKGSSLGERLKKFGVQLKKIGIAQKDKLVEYLMDKNTTGMYVCMLNDQQFTSSHAIAVDCNNHPTLILDCCETSALELTKKNLDKCCGRECIFQHISHIGQIIYAESKSNSWKGWKEGLCSKFMLETPSFDGRPR